MWEGSEAHCDGEEHEEVTVGGVESAENECRWTAQDECRAEGVARRREEALDAAEEGSWVARLTYTS